MHLCKSTANFSTPFRNSHSYGKINYSSGGDRREINKYSNAVFLAKNDLREKNKNTSKWKEKGENKKNYWNCWSSSKKVFPNGQYGANNKKKHY